MSAEYKTDGHTVTNDDQYFMGIFSTVSMLNDKIKEIERLKAELARVKGIAEKVCDYYERVANTEEICIGNFARECKKELGKI